MSHEQWFDREEMLDDLVAVSGRHTRGDMLRQITDRPPIVPSGYDDEMQEFMRRYGRNDSLGATNDGPDLTYIANLIAQAQLYENHPDYNNEQETKALAQPQTLVVSKPSRLDPNVPEFKPKSAENPNDDVHKTTTAKDSKIIPELSIGNGDNMSNNSNKIADNAARHSSKSDVEKAADELKKTIVAENKKTIENKLKKNAALMSLMKLYASTAPSTLQNTKVEEPDRVQLPIKVELPVEKKETIKERFEEVSARQVAESIKKVDSWLSGPKDTPKDTSSIKPKTKFTIQTKPFTFKKKERPIVVETPKTSECSASTQSLNSGSKKFVPSAFAQELYQKLEKQHGQRVSGEADDKTLWGVIERKLLEHKHE